ncbi:CehA/McbA family metallohydrolase [Streptomyces radicis]|uniref:Phosphoesterase n=1 Tax=Streptomyces radicis TaxID=1750517 RepID=A0A3A9W932_9ACTN|nr:CehA/McbA family metallohydrolase [Streptomyces radicis]RKN09811.1 phosphoesterase [Streptomyces radicis]RKN23448.1 phosphoesterase [Streptomyces radicis]
MAPVEFAQADDGAEQTRTLRGHLAPGAPDFVYLPVQVPPGVRRIAVSYAYDRPEVPAGTRGNALDIGVFDERGTDPPGEGFRGWSGGARTAFTIGAEGATPGYLAGPVGAGVWHVVLAPYTVAPGGLDYEVTVPLTHGRGGRTPRPAYPPERAAGRGRAWYRGDCHLHTVYSDGRRTPAEVAAAARAGGLDFIVTTEHNTPAGHGAWEGLWGPDLLVLCGEEVTTRNGHCLALGIAPGTFIDWRYRARDGAFAHYARRIRRAGGLVVPAHPHAACVGCSWRFGFAEADAVEVWNGPWTPTDEAHLATWDGMLRSGDAWLPAMGNSDAHREPQRVGLPQTVVLADDLTRRAILDGIGSGRSYLAESSSVALTFGADDGRGRHAGIGERLDAPPEAPVTARLTASGVPGGEVRLVSDQGVMHTGHLSAAGTGEVSWTTTPGNATWVRAEVRHPAPEDGAPGVPGPIPGPMAAMTNPVFLGAGPHG